MILSLSPGSIVTAREREWVVLPSPDDSLYFLHPLTGGEGEICGIYRPLVRLGLERVEPAAFPLPSADDFSDALGATLLWDAARLALREGAGPLRSLGKLSVRPRPYRFVPLLMALRSIPSACSSPTTSVWARRSRRCSSPARCSTAAKSSASTCFNPFRPMTVLQVSFRTGTPARSRPRSASKSSTRSTTPGQNTAHRVSVGSCKIR